MATSQQKEAVLVFKNKIKNSHTGVELQAIGAQIALAINAGAISADSVPSLKILYSNTQMILKRQAHQCPHCSGQGYIRHPSWLSKHPDGMCFSCNGQGIIAYESKVAIVEDEREGA